MSKDNIRKRFRIQEDMQKERNAQLALKQASKPLDASNAKVFGGARIYLAPSKEARQAAFVKSVRANGMSSKDAVKKASLFPDFDRSKFKVLRMVA